MNNLFDLPADLEIHSISTCYRKIIMWMGTTIVAYLFRKLPGSARVLPTTKLTLTGLEKIGEWM